MYKTLLFSSFFMLSLIGYSQNMITGKVVIDELNEQVDVSSIMIQNLQTNRKEYTNELGIFSIRVSLNDVLEFSGEFIETRKLTITESILQKGYLEVHLNVETIELETANLNTLNKDFKSNIGKEDSQTSKNYISWGFDPNLQYIKVNPNMKSTLNNNGLLDPSLMISKITGKYKKDKKQNEYFLRVNSIDDIKSYFTENYYVKVLGIPAIKINEFLNYCSSQSNIIHLFKQLNFEAVENHLFQCSSNYIKLLNQK